MGTPFVCLDPGHGGHDGGAIYAEAIEKDLNLNLAFAVRAAVEGLGWQCGCEMTRQLDDTLSLAERGQRSHELGASLVISLHHNAAESGARGMIGFALDSSGPAAEVARAIVDAAPRELRRKSNDVLTARSDDWTSRAFNCLSVHRCPALLLEVGFLSNERDRQALQSDAVQCGIVAACLAGIAHFLRIQEVAP